MPETAEHCIRTLTKSAERHGIPRNRLGHLLRAGEIPYLRMHERGERMIDDRDVIAWIEKRKIRRGDDAA